jgi:hypothetical protein
MIASKIGESLQSYQEYPATSAMGRIPDSCATKKLAGFLSEIFKLLHGNNCFLTRAGHHSPDYSSTIHKFLFNYAIIPSQAKSRFYSKKISKRN